MRAFLELAGALLRPWAVAAAALAVAAAAFQPRPTGHERGLLQYGVGFSVGAAEGWSGRALSFAWDSWPAEGEEVHWIVTGGDYGVLWTYGGWGLPSRRHGPLGTRVRGASIGFLSLHAELLWWLGVPLIGSAVGVWRLHQRRTEGVHEPADGPGLPWRLARPWVWLFAPLGVALVVLGGEPWTVGDHRTLDYSERFVEFARDEADGPPGRALVLREVALTEVSWGVPESLEPLGRMETVELPGVAADWSVSHVMYSDIGNVVVSKRRAALSVWWLVAVAAVFNFFTLGRLVRQRGNVRSA
ncbi:hypothetical protein [Alienimonas sp. DA493]|uniref:hypothetical protein n=1 Tax=Alienimonas sp. DA493 TaxID=3373605 RepID=UPI003754D420